ncbi:hypothetical protein HK100_009191 [Physocladia obscura]|uniref:Uncharacterized protein n=1 Tax=Physocladia obscura TaxID=109957 RepID=A0AAD5XEB8_9FUNG|nr:hypothetical protein HK100_009191 [Physocladia obscura]
MRTAATAAVGGGTVAYDTMAVDDDPRRLSFEPIDLRFGTLELDTERPEMPSRLGFTTVSSSSTSIATSTDDGSDRLSLLSRSVTQQPFDQDSWVAAYEQSQPQTTANTTINTAAAAASLLSTSLSSLSLVLDWDDDSDDDDPNYEEEKDIIPQNKDLDHDDRFIENVKARLKESEELESQKTKQQQESLDLAAAAAQKPISKRFSNIFPSFLGLSLPPAAPILDQNQSSLDTRNNAENRSLSQSNRNQNSWGEDSPALVAETEQSPKKPSQLISFINRAFGPRRNLQAQQQRRSTIQGANSTFPRRNHDPHALDADNTNNINNQKIINRASMPHVAWSSWSSNTAMTPSASTSSKRVSRASSTTSSATEHIRGGSGNSSARETRELIAQGLKLFEVGATETAFATFQRAVASATPNDTFARYCVAVCIAHGYGCTEDNIGVQMLKELKGMGEVLADEELAILGIE